MKAWEFLSKRGVWCKGNYAVDKNGIAINPLDNLAVKFCVLGAICKCYPEEKEFVIVRDMLQLVKGKISDWNDDPKRKKYQVVELLKKLDI